ncbi:MAG: outer membrane beta-barrel protein [Bacteroidales bacterium]|nr:outer membrane beta-barrel protein [Bacteroidales bacterium]
MKRIVVVMMMLLTAMTAGAKGKGDWKGKVVDAQGEPVAYANVVVLSKADSTVLCGTVTAEDGTYNIVTGETDGIMMVAMLGYQTVYMSPVDGAVIALKEDMTMLESAVTTAVMPKTKLTGEGLQTNVRGSVLENVGNANDVLARTPGIISKQEGIEVIGKGSPLIFINGRKVTDPGELARLQSNEIQSIEVITNPGARYDATVRSVVRIRTIKRQGDGFGFSFTASDAQSLRIADFNDPYSNLNVNYRKGGVDLFAGINYDKTHFSQVSDAEKKTSTSPVYIDNAGINGREVSSSLGGNAGINWQIADNHFVGGKVEWGRNLSHADSTVITDRVTRDGVLVDNITTVTKDHFGDIVPYNLGTNLYYNGTVGEKLNIDFNADYYTNVSTIESRSDETSGMTYDAKVSTSSENRSHMYATKLVLTYPVLIGQLELGTEETFSRLSDKYTLSGIIVPASDASVKEDNISGFASYAFYLPKVGQVSAGVRYEHVDYNYVDALAHKNDISRTYDNWFPTVSYANAFGPVQVLLNYSAKTQRPDFSMLSSAIRYNSRYLWQSGNAALQPQIMHEVGLTALWKFFTLGVNYSHVNNAIVTWASPYNDEGVLLVKPRNLEEPFREMTAFVNLSPTIGPLTLNYTFALQPQWLTINAPDPSVPSGIRQTSFNDKPLFVTQLFNTLRVKGGWQFELGSEVYSRGYSENIYLTNIYCNVTAAIQKSLLKDGSLVLRLEGKDLTGMAHNDIKSDFGVYKVWQTNIFDTQRVKFTIRYTFNAAQSKYKGTGAGADIKDRM